MMKNIFIGCILNQVAAGCSGSRWFVKTQTTAQQTTAQPWSVFPPTGTRGDKLKRTFFIIAVFIFSGVGLFAQQYTPVDAGSSVKFVVKNFGLNVDGSFKGLRGTMIFNPGNLASSNFTVSVDAATVNTGNSSRDGHLKKDDYFDVAKYPQINFTSTKMIATAKPGQYAIEGNFTIKGITKAISFPFNVSDGGNVFTGQFKINRRDFKVGGNSLVLSDDVTVTLNVSTVKQ